VALRTDDTSARIPRIGNFRMLISGLLGETTQSLHVLAGFLAASWSGTSSIGFGSRRRRNCLCFCICSALGAQLRARIHISRKKEVVASKTGVYIYIYIYGRLISNSDHF